MGDYISTSIVANKAYPVIANAKKGEGTGNCVLGQITSCNEFMVAPSDGLPIQSGTVLMRRDRVRADHSDHRRPAPFTVF